MSISATQIVCLLILLVWVGIAASSGQGIIETQHSRLLLDFGALNATHIENGEYWRLLVSQFTHVKFFHMLANVAFIFVLGGAIEKRHNLATFLIVYFLSGLLGLSASVFVYPNLVSSGASQALCGLAGFLLIFSRQLFATNKWLLFAVIVFVAIQAGLDLYFAGYLKAGHTVGFLTGGAIGACIEFMPNKAMNRTF